jgi:hypothetical protein
MYSTLGINEAGKEPKLKQNLKGNAEEMKDKLTEAQLAKITLEEASRDLRLAEARAASVLLAIFQNNLANLQNVVSQLENAVKTHREAEIAYANQSLDDDISF